MAQNRGFIFGRIFISKPIGLQPNNHAEFQASPNIMNARVRALWLSKRKSRYTISSTKRQLTLEQGNSMEMTKVNAGKLRAIGYEPKTRTLRVELEDGSALEYANVGESIWRNLKASGNQWSYYRDNIEEEFTAKRVSAKPSGGKNPLDELFN
jgi:hypothetical protein